MAKKKQITQLDDSPIPVAIDGVVDDGGENTVAEGLKETKARFKGNWIKMTADEAIEYGTKGVLFGYDPESGEGLLKEDQ